MGPEKNCEPWTTVATRPNGEVGPGPISNSNGVEFSTVFYST